jgi:nucleotide-binding universal stress UspA family protein
MNKKGDIKKIQILGLEDNRHKEMLKTLKEAMESLSVDADVEEVTDIESFLRYNLLRVPALTINGDIVFHHSNHNLELGELKALLRKYFSNQFIMENILVPTDFSKTSKGAYHYALRLAEYFNSNIQVIHVYHPSFNPGYPLETNTNILMLEPKKELMKQFIHQGEKGKDPINTLIDVKDEIISGFAAEEIVRMSKTEEIDLVVMGTTGDNTILEKVFGSISSEVSKYARSPVLLVPDGAKFKAYRNIVYASNFEKIDSQVMDKIVDFAGRFSAGIHLVDVHENKEAGRYKVSEQLLEQQLNERLPTLEFKMAEVESSTIWEGLNRYADDNDVDLLVMVTQHRKVLENMFHKSITRQVAVHSKLPILILHVDD